MLLRGDRFEKLQQLSCHVMTIPPAQHLRNFISVEVSINDDNDDLAGILLCRRSFLSATQCLLLCVPSVVPVCDSGITLSILHYNFVPAKSSTDK